MYEISIDSSPCISSTFKHNVIKLNYYSMIVRKQKTPTAAFFASIPRYRTFFPETPNSIISLKVSNILNPSFDHGLVCAKNIRRPDLDKINSSD